MQHTVADKKKCSVAIFGYFLNALSELLQILPVYEISCENIKFKKIIWKIFEKKILFKKNENFQKKIFLRKKLKLLFFDFFHK